MPSGSVAVVIVKEGCPIVKVWLAEAAPPGFCTVTLAVPAEATLMAGTEAINCVALLNADGSTVPFHNTDAPGTKLVPATVMENPGSPAFAVAGVSEVIVGPLIGNCTGVESGAPGFCTVTLAL